MESYISAVDLGDRAKLEFSQGGGSPWEYGFVRGYGSTWEYGSVRGNMTLFVDMVHRITIWLYGIGHRITIFVDLAECEKMALFMDMAHPGRRLCSWIWLTVGR